MSECEIFNHEIVAEPRYYLDDNKQLLLRILKRKGAPVIGNMILEMDLKNYKWTFWNNIENKSSYYKWEKVK